MTKTMDVVDVKDAKEKIQDIVVVGNGDLFQLISKASSVSQGWMKSTKAMEIPNTGCVVQVTTQQKNPDGSYAIAEALTFVEGVCIHVDDNLNKFLGPIPKEKNNYPS